MWVLAVVVGVVAVIGVIALLGRSKAQASPEMAAALGALHFEASHDRTAWFLNRGGAASLTYSPPRSRAGPPCHRLYISWFLDGTVDLAPPAVLAHRGLVVRCWPAGGAPLSGAARPAQMLPADTLPGLSIEARFSAKDAGTSGDRPLSPEQVSFVKQILGDAAPLASKLSGSELSFDDNGFSMASIELCWPDAPDAGDRLETAVAWLRAVEAQLPGGGTVEPPPVLQTPAQTQAALKAQGFARDKHGERWSKDRDGREDIFFEPPGDAQAFNRIGVRWEPAFRSRFPTRLDGFSGALVECWPAGGAPLEAGASGGDSVQALPAETLLGLAARGSGVTDRLDQVHELFDRAREQLARLPSFSFKLDATASDLFELSLCWPASRSFEAELPLALWWISNVEAHAFGAKGDLPLPELPAVAAKAADAAGPVRKGELEPLICARCGAPVPVGDTDETTCVACGSTAPLPEPYRNLRAARRMSQDDAAKLQALAAEVSRPPPAWQRTAMIVGFVVGGATAAVMALGAIIGGIAGAVAGDQLDLGDTVAKLFAIVGAVAAGIVSVPFAGEWVAALASLHHTAAATTIVTSPATAYHYDLVAAAALYLLGVVPIALAIRTKGNLDGITELQGRLAAQPSASPGGGMCCRHCGAALDLPRGALVSRCLYCGADNLLEVPADLASAHKDQAKELDAEVQGAVDKRELERRGDRSRMWGLMILGVLLVPYLCLAGYVLHRLVMG